jgi:hypothetical protein
MDYAKLNRTILDKVMAALLLINNPEIDPVTRQKNQEILFRTVGAAVYTKIYHMNAFDFEIEHTTGPGIDERYYGLAKVAAAAPSTGTLGLKEYVKNFLDYSASAAQRDAMRTAKQSGKAPRVIRTPNGDTCKWCRSLAGEYTDPPSDVFHRHGGCDCNIRTEGYRSRNGLLNNYVKPVTR